MITRDAEGHLVVCALADAVATLAGLATARPPSDVDRMTLWAISAEDRLAPESGYVVLIPFAGVPVDDVANRIAIQIYAVAPVAIDALALNAKIFDALLEDSALDDERTPRRSWPLTLAGQSNFPGTQWLADVFGLTEGGLIGRDANDRYEAVSNFELAYRRV